MSQYEDIDTIEFDDDTEVSFVDIDIMCKTCHELCAHKDGKCSYCLKGNKKCNECKLYWAPKDKLYCSECEPIVQYLGIELTVEQIVKLPNSGFKGKKMNEHLNELFALFKAEKCIKNIITSNPILLNLCKDKSPGEVFCTLDGQRGFIPCMLPATFADKLLDQCIETVSSDKQYKYIHAIAPFILDVWNMPQKHGVLECYYKDTGSLRKCPNNLEELHSLWKRSIGAYFIHDLDDVIVCDCVVCADPIKLKTKKFRCKACYGNIHYECIKAIATGECPYCDAKWTITKPVNDNIDFGSILLV